MRAPISRRHEYGVDSGRRLVPFTALLLVACVALSCSESSAGEAEAAAARLVAGPDFELLGLDGDLHSLADYRGKVLLVNYWATWCVACREEMPILHELHRQLSGDDVEIIGIATDVEGSPKVRPYVEELAIDYAILLDPRAVSPALFGGIEGYPKTFILDREGLIYSTYLGAQTDEVFREDLLYLLEALPSPAADRPPASAHP